jgi:prepilin-type processing-associated H-X9-DG protein
MLSYSSAATGGSVGFPHSNGSFSEYERLSDVALVNKPGGSNIMFFDFHVEMIGRPRIPCAVRSSAAAALNTSFWSPWRGASDWNDAW